MIQPTELRIGNYIEYDGNYYKIDSLSRGLPTLNTLAFGIGVVDYNNINPIPLTEEILIKCGFKRIHQSKFRAVDIHIFCYLHETMNGDWILDIDGRTISVVKSLHQLQNLYHAITGNELEINL